jgi:crotonobetainyl-CoA:carnitine CoA-transferase CaiB-like acyl-CoA transferase
LTKPSALLQDLKVIELASVLAGPSVGMFFAELGAKVIKVENKNSGGDVTRSWKLASEDAEHPFSAYYSSVNWGKESWMLDLNDQADKQELLREIENADVVIANFKAGGAAKLGLDYTSLKKLKLDLIYGEITGFGDSARIAYDVVLQAESGFLSMCGEPGGKPVKMPVALIDLLAAHQLKEGLLLALLGKERNGKGAKVSVSLYDAALASLANQATNYLMANHIAEPMGTLHPNIAPYGECFACQAGKMIVLAVGNNKQFAGLCKVLKLEDLPHDARFQHNHQRVKNRAKLAVKLDQAIKAWEREELLQALIAADVPAGAVRNMQEVLEKPEAQARIREEEKEGQNLTTLSGNAFEID